MHENGAVRVLYDEIWNIGRASRFVAFQEKIIILSLSTHGRFLQAKGQGYRQGLQAGATGRVYRRGQVPLKVQKRLKSNKHLPKSKKVLTNI